MADAYSMQFVNPTIRKKSELHRIGSGEVVYEHIKHKITKENLVIDFDIINTTGETQEGIIIGFDFFVDGDPVFGNDTGHIPGYESGIRLRAREKGISMSSLIIILAVTHSLLL